MAHLWAADNKDAILCRPFVALNPAIRVAGYTSIYSTGLGYVYDYHVLEPLGQNPKP